jgi:nucleoside-diphosphate-sugar epimerase
MHVFVTGGTGTIGSAVVAELLNNGHTVLALARSDSSEQTLKNAGAEVLRGGLADLDVLRAGAAQSDGVISLAFSPDYHSSEGLAAAITEESAATAALGAALTGSDRPIVTVSGTQGCRAAPPPRRTRCLAKDRSPAGPARSMRCSDWPRAACAPRRCACRARSTTRARADSPA